MTPLRPVILVGHCLPDAHMLKSAISRAVPHAAVTLVNDERRLHDHLNDGALLLINRVLDGAFSLDSGVGLIESLSRRERPPTMMLVSNFPDAQDHAVAAGALRGFGKSHLYTDATMNTLRHAIQRNGSATH